MICEYCLKDHDGSYGSGRFCSNKCTKGFATKNVDYGEEKIANCALCNVQLIVKKNACNIQYCTSCKNLKYTHTCEKCGDEFKSGTKAYYNKIHCNKCKRKTVRSCNVNSILDLSSRTVAKLLKRANIGCQICGWNKASCDIHHIVEVCNNGSNDQSNLIVICPNCHREIHSAKKYSKQFLEARSIEKCFSNWRDFYNPIITQYVNSLELNKNKS